MVDLTQVTLTDGVPTGGTGTAATINALMADGGQETLGATTDAASTETDATAATLISISKQISKSIQALEALWPTALGAGGGLKVDGSGTALPVTVASVPSHAVTNSGTFATQDKGGATSSTTLTPAASAYSANDVLQGALTFANICAVAGDIVIENATLMIDRDAVQASEGAYRLHLYNVTPPSALADNAAWDLPSGDRASYLGFVDITIPVDLGSTCYVQITGLNKRVKTLSTSIFGYLVTVAGYTETAVVHTVTLSARSV